jgi:hypothetical protein
MQYISIASLVASAIIIAFGCLVLLLSIWCDIDIDMIVAGLIIVGIGAAFAVITFRSADYYTKVFTERAQNNVAIEETVNTETTKELNTDENSTEEVGEQTKTPVKETFLLSLAVAAPFVIIFLFVLFVILFIIGVFTVSTENVDDAEKETEEAKKYNETKENEEVPDNGVLYDECVSYNCLISEWGKKATEFQDDDFANTLYGIAEKLRDLEEYRKKGLIGDSVVNKVYNLYLQDFKEYYKTYCTYIDIDIDTEEQKGIIELIRKNIIFIQDILTKVAQAEVEKDIEMKRAQIAASRKSLETIVAQHGYTLENKG